LHSHSSQHSTLWRRSSDKNARTHKHHMNTRIHPQRIFQHCTPVLTAHVFTSPLATPSTKLITQA
jgi:hypothetical protein